MKFRTNFIFDNTYLKFWWDIDVTFRSDSIERGPKNLSCKDASDKINSSVFLVKSWKKKYRQNAYAQTKPKFRT